VWSIIPERNKAGRGDRRLIEVALGDFAARALII
jgi:hypothetical protein